MDYMNQLYHVHKNGYPEDWVLVYTDSIEKVIEQYCKDTDREQLTEDEFYEGYECFDISHIGEKKIKEIIFED